MPKDINLLPENLRGREEKIRKKQVAKAMRFHIPQDNSKKDPSTDKRHLSVLSFFKSAFSRKEKAEYKSKKKTQKVSKEKSDAISKEERPVLAYQASKKSTSEKRSVLTSKKDASVPKHIASRASQKIVSQKKANKVFNKDNNVRRVFSLSSPTKKQPVIRKAKEDSPETTQDERLHMPEQPVRRIFGIDLLSVSRLSKTTIDKMNMRWRALGAFVVLLAIVYVVLFSFVSARQNRANESLRGTRQEIAALEEEWLSMQDDLAQAAIKTSRILAAKSLLDSRRMWTKVFDFFEDHTVDGVSYSSININGDDTSVFLDLRAQDYELFVYQLLVYDGLPNIIESYEFGDIVRVNSKDPLDKSIHVGLTVVFADEFLKDAR